MTASGLFGQVIEQPRPSQLFSRPALEEERLKNTNGIDLDAGLAHNPFNLRLGVTAAIIAPIRYYEHPFARITPFSLHLGESHHHRVEQRGSSGGLDKSQAV